MAPSHLWMQPFERMIIAIIADFRLMTLGHLTTRRRRLFELLERLEKHLGPLGEVKSVADALRSLKGIVADFGFRSGVVVQYATDDDSVVQTLDTWPERGK